MEVKQAKLKPKSDQDRLNDLIDWYEKNKPNAGRVIQVNISPEYLDKFAKKIPDEPKRWNYRGRILERP